MASNGLLSVLWLGDTVLFRIIETVDLWIALHESIVDFGCEYVYHLRLLHRTSRLAALKRQSSVNSLEWAGKVKTPPMPLVESNCELRTFWSELRTFWSALPTLPSDTSLAAQVGDDAFTAWYWPWGMGHYCESILHLGLETPPLRRCDIPRHPNRGTANAQRRRRWRSALMPVLEEPIQWTAYRLRSRDLALATSASPFEQHPNIQSARILRRLSLTTPLAPQSRHVWDIAHPCRERAHRPDRAIQAHEASPSDFCRISRFIDNASSRSAHTASSFTSRRPPVPQTRSHTGEAPLCNNCERKSTLYDMPPLFAQAL
ncbi:hypothetical protein C8R47DRAFT_264236 [Mycena vitilis]|nr:hypothetical protein C8R47DRAFT_264236 [Mycena vitilis]